MGIEPHRYLCETLTKLLAREEDLAALLPETHAQKLAAEREQVAAADDTATAATDTAA